VALERIAMIYGAQGQLEKASEQFAELVRTAPQTLTDFDKIAATLRHLIPALNSALAAPQSVADVSTTIAVNPFFQAVLESTLVRDVALENWLTAQRAGFLRRVRDGRAIEDDELAFAGALAQQCFINEYLFSVAPDEAVDVEWLKATIVEALAAGKPIEPAKLTVLGMYTALCSLPDALALTKQSWPAAVDAVITQQVREPHAEQGLRATIPRLTEINEGITAQVRQQYEENPYPRWVRLPQAPLVPLMLDDHLRRQFPSAAFRPVGARDSLDVLVAGCGTGRNALEIAQSFRGANILGVDLSLSSLTHAKRKIPPALSGAVEFAQGDILKLGSLGREFDFIDVGGVLHHMEDALGGWRALIKLMKPDGVMLVGLYSAHARKEIVAARKLIAERGYPPTPEGIRRCRQDLRSDPEQFKFMGLRDFYSVSECRDLMFHVHERQFTIPEIKAFLIENDLKFIGFEFTPPEAHVYHRDVFGRAGWSLSDLDRWDAYERANPDIFAGMYIFWVQKN
jgi:SAM-dependent methyltransferase